MSLAMRRALLALIAILIAEATWIVTVPPFRGSDEIDHVYRAAGVASGQWRLTEGASNGRGVLVWVPTDIVQAAEKQCVSLTYTKHDNCHAARTSGDRSLVATSAGGYDPGFYAVVGTAAKPFHGAAADYAMRIATALMCAVLLALGVGLVSIAGAGRWATLGVWAAITPEVLFSAAIPSPNGPEMSLAFVLWAALLAAVRQLDGSVVQRRLLTVAVMAMVPLTFLRMLGPLWICLILGAVCLTTGAPKIWAVVRRQRGVVLAGIVLGAVGVSWWYVWMTSLGVATGGQADPDTKNWWLAFNLPVFTMQMIGVFPFRDEPMPLWVYPASFFVIGLMLWAVWRRATESRHRRAALWIVVIAVVVPIVLSLIFMPSQGAVWQGRYELPFVVGVLPWCGLVLDDMGFAPIEAPRLIVVSAVCLTIPQVVSVMGVQHAERQRPASIGDPAWWHPPSVFLGLLMLVACLIAVRVPRSRAMPGREHAPVPLSARR